MITDPLLFGSVQFTVIDPFELVEAATALGASGTPGMVTELDKAEGSDVPEPLVAETEKL